VTGQTNLLLAAAMSFSQSESATWAGPDNGGQILMIEIAIRECPRTEGMAQLKGAKAILAATVLTALLMLVGRVLPCGVPQVPRESVNVSFLLVLRKIIHSAWPGESLVQREST